jgi:hypothetical protein
VTAVLEVAADVGGGDRVDEGRERGVEHLGGAGADAAQ